MYIGNFYDEACKKDKIEKNIDILSNNIIR